MAEVSRIQPRGRDFLATRGVPERFLQVIRPDGLTPDYFNYFLGTETILKNYNLGNPDAGTEIRKRLNKIPTYTEYWRERVETETDNPEALADLIVNAYRGSRTLNFIIETMRKSVNNESLSPQDLIRHFVILTSIAYRKLDSSPRGLARIKQMRRDFGMDQSYDEK